MTKPAAAYENASIELCLNEQCAKGNLISEIPSDANYGIGVYQQMLADGVSISLTLWLREPRPYLEISRSMFIVTNLHDGDRYTIKLTQRDSGAMVR